MITGLLGAKVEKTEAQWNEQKQKRSGTTTYWDHLKRCRLYKTQEEIKN